MRRLPPGCFSIAFPDRHKVAVEGTLACQVGQRIRGCPVNIVSVGGKLTPATFRGDGYSRWHVVGDDDAELAPAASILDSHLITVTDATRSGINWIDLDERGALPGDQAGYIC